jgi:hypothetical protein
MSPADRVRASVASALAYMREDYEVAPDRAIIVGDRTVIVGCPSDAPDYDGTVSIEVYVNGRCALSRMCWYRDLSLVDDLDEVMNLMVGVA